MSHAKGSRYERELVNRFRASEWGALRLPSSGSATDADLPDVLAGRGVAQTLTRSHLLAVELKAGDATTLYVDEAEVAALERFADRWGATPILGARFTTQGSETHTYLVRPADARRTDGGNYGLPRADIDGRAEWLVTPDGVVR